MSEKTKRTVSLSEEMERWLKASDFGCTTNNATAIKLILHHLAAAYPDGLPLGWDTQLSRNSPATSQPSGIPRRPCKGKVIHFPGNRGH